MQKLTILTIVLTLLLTSCGSTPVETAPTQDVNALYTQAAETIIAGMQDAPAEATQEPTLPPPTEVPQQQTEQFDNIYSWNYPVEQTIGGLTIQVARVLIADKDSLEKEMGEDFDQAEIFIDKPVIVEILYKITNNAAEAITIHPNQGTVIIGSEQIDLSEYMLSGASIGEDIGGDIYPGVTRIGGIWFGVKRSSLNDINNMMIILSQPVASDDWESLGDDFQLNIDLGTKTFVPMPDELK